MQHLAQIQNEFLKHARKWDDLSYEEQKSYLQRHPASKRRITARPGSKGKPKRGEDKKKIREEMRAKKVSDLKKFILDKKPNVDVKGVGKDELVSYATRLKMKELRGKLKGKSETAPKKAPKEAPKKTPTGPKLQKSKSKKKKPPKGSLSRRKYDREQSREEAKVRYQADVESLKESLPDDQKKYAKYIADSSVDPRGKRELQEVHNGVPIIAVTEKYDGYTGTFEVPVAKKTEESLGKNHYGFGPAYETFDDVEHAKYFLDNIDDFVKRAKLRNQIGELNDQAKLSQDEKLPYDVYTIKMMIDAPREDRYGTEIDAAGNEKKYIAEKAVKGFRLSSDDHKRIKDTIYHPTSSSVSSDDIQFTIDHLDDFFADFDMYVDYASKPKDQGGPPRGIDEWTQKESKALSGKKNIILKRMKRVLPLMKKKAELQEEHGYETPESLTLPEGFKVVDKPSIGQGWMGSDVVNIENEDGTISLSFKMKKPNDSGTYTPMLDGEIYYKVPGKPGTYQVGRHGVDWGLSYYYDDRDTSNASESLAKSIEDVRKKQDKLAGAKSVTITNGKSWSITPERMQEISGNLKAGKAQQFTPHGMGTGHLLSTSPSSYSRRADKGAEEAFGISPLYVTDFDYD